MKEANKDFLTAQFKDFTDKNFEVPKQCRDLNQVEFYIQELKMKMKEFKQSFDFVPKFAYNLLWEYTSIQNDMVHNGTYHTKNRA